MTPLEFKNIRLDLGLTQPQFATFLGLKGKYVDRTIRRWETGERAIPPTVIKYLQVLRLF